MALYSFKAIMLVQINEVFSYWNEALSSKEDHAPATWKGAVATTELV